MNESSQAEPRSRAIEWIDRHPFWCFALLAAVGLYLTFRSSGPVSEARQSP